MPHQLSGGEQQRVALARADRDPAARCCCSTSRSSNLDAKLRVQMRSEIRDLQKRLGITTIYVTHDQEEAMAISDRIAVMDKGAVVQEGTAEELYYRPADEFVARFIGRTNLVEGRVTSGRRGRDRGRTAWPSPQAWRPASACAWWCGRRMIELRARRMTAGAARIVQRTFLGEKTDYLVALGDAALQVRGRRHEANWCRTTQCPVQNSISTAWRLGMNKQEET